MKKTAIFLCALLLFLLIPVSSYSMDYSEEEYNKTLSSYDLSSFEKELDADTYKMLDELGVLDFSYESITGLSFNDIVGLLKSLFQKKAELPIKSSVTVLIFILLSAFLQSLKAESDDSVKMIYSTATALLVATVVLVKLTSTVSLASMAISVASNFVYAFIPVFCSIVVASGGITTGFSTNTTLLILAQGLSFISSNVFMPIVNCYLALGVTSSLRYELNLDKLLSSVKKIITTCISFVSGVFVSGCCR